MTLVAEPPTAPEQEDQPELFLVPLMEPWPQSTPQTLTEPFPAVYPILPAQDLQPVDKRVRDLFLSPEGFRHWLETRPAGSLVGARQDAQTCPLATFGTQTLRSAVGGLSVHADRIYIMPGDQLSKSTVTLRAVPTPTWCMRFIRAIDHSPFPLISAQQALTLLRYLEMEAPL